MKKYENYYIETYRARSGNITGWTFQIFEGSETEPVPIMQERPKEIFDSKMRAYLAAIGYISMMKGGK